MTKEGPPVNLVMEEPKIGVNQGYSQLIARLDHNLVGSGAGWGGDELYPALNKERERRIRGQKTKIPLKMSWQPWPFINILLRYG